ncbi:hypothetical protein BH11BAC3_BH11BAC3_37570 [soil metagenome]
MVFKGIFLKGLRQLVQQRQLLLEGIDLERVIKKAGYKKWNVYAKSPFGSVANVGAYLGRYTHKIAITPHRIVSISEHSVLFTYRDYQDGNRQKEMRLSQAEFLRCFELHILPKGFVKIRHYGLLQNHGKRTRLNKVRQQLKLSALPPKVQVPVSVRMLQQYGKDITLCPKCNSGKLMLIHIDYGGSVMPIRKNQALITDAKSQGLAPP